MNHRLKLCAFIVLGVGAVQAQPIAVPALGPRFKQTHERAEALFGPRNGTHPLPDAQLNLFRASADIAPPRVTPAAGEAPRPVLPADQTILQEALAALKKGGGGLVAIGGRTHLTFNQKVYKDGDSLSIPVRGKAVEIHITRISSSSVILSLNESEVVWWF